MNETREALEARLKEDGRWQEALNYQDEIFHGLKDGDGPKSRFRQQAWDDMEKEYPPLPVEEVEAEPELELEPEEEITVEEIAGLEFAPDFLRWAALNPALRIPESKETDQIRAQMTEYEQEYPCPNQLARTMFTDCRNNATDRRKLISDLVKHHFEDMKAGDKDKDAALIADRKHTKKIEDVLGLTKPA